jgi:hypothetical protein
MMNFIKKEKVFIVVALLAVLLTAGVVYQFFTKPTAKQGVTLAEGFPVMPLYPRAYLVDSKADPLEGALYIGVRYGATWEVKADVPKVAKWYTEKLQEAGWTLDTVSANPEAADVQLVTFYNDEHSLNMSFTREAGSKITKVTAEFTTLQRDYCDDRHGEICK